MKRRWANTLKEYVFENAIQGKIDANHDVERRLKTILMEREEEKMKKEPTLKMIPKFYVKKKDIGGHHRQSQNEQNLDEAQRILRRLARNRLLERKSAEIYTDEDLNLLYTLIQEKPTINYEDLVQIGAQMDPKRSHDYFSPLTFSKFRRDRWGHINTNTFFQYICRHVALQQIRIQLSIYDTTGDGYLREVDLENFIYEIIPTVEPLADLQENFYPFYVFTAVRKFFFFLDPRRTCKIAIKDLITSPVLDELLQLRDENWDEETDNWFSAHNALRVYSQYLECDKDHNGMLNQSELQQYGTGSLTKVFIDRVFEECLTYSGEMDYKTFLDFVLAMETKKSPQSLAYFWRLLDIKKQGYLDIFTINYFFREIVQRLRELDGDVASVEDVKDEIFDMCKPENPTRITFKDLQRCKVGDTIVSMLTDLNGFWEYDNRENLIAEEAREEFEQQMLQEQHSRMHQ